MKGIPLKLANVRDIKNKLSAYINCLGRDDVIITKNGKPKAILYSFSEKDFKDYLLEQSPQFKKIIATRWKMYLQEGGIPIEKISKKLQENIIQ